MSVNKKLKFIFLALLSFALFGRADSSQAADHYVRQGASGANNGSDWTNAWTVLPSTLTRGDTYYIADGNYPSYAVDDAVSGNMMITIKKAISSDHGTAIGWDDSYGNDQAVISSPFNIRTSFVVFDGLKGAGSDVESYGFKMGMPADCNLPTGMQLIGIPPMGYASLSLSDVTVSHVAMINCGSTHDLSQMGIYSNPANASNITISHNYFRDSSSNILFRRWKNSTISDNYFGANWSSSNNHGQQISPGLDSDDITVKNNIFKDSYVFVLGVHYLENDRWNVHNNLIINGALNGCFASVDTGGDAMKNWEVHHNTFVDTVCGGYGTLHVGELTDENLYRSRAYNNLFYNVNNYGFDDSVDNKYNAYFNCSGINSIASEGGTAQIGTGDPFVDSANGNYRLKEHTLSGADLGSPFNIDFAGNVRSFWDRGVYEFVSGAPSDTTAPAAPSGLAVN